MMYFNGVVPVKSQKRVWLCFDVREHCLLWYSGEIMRKFVNRATAERMKNYSSEGSTYIEVLDDKYGYNRSAFRMGISDDPHTKYGEPVFVRAFNLDKQYLKEILLTLGIFVITGTFLTHFYEEYLVVTRIMSIFALYNVNKHSMPRQKREKNGTGICHVMQGKESKTCPYDFRLASVRSVSILR